MFFDIIIFMNISTCQQKLNTILSQLQNSSSRNVSQIVDRARWDNKSDCISFFGGLQKVNTYVQNADISNLPTTNTNTTTSTSTPSFTDTIAGDSMAIVTLGKNIGILLMLLFIWYLLYKAIRYVTIFLYDVRNSDRMVHLRVLQTRGDSKIDREANKELAKD